MRDQPALVTLGGRSLSYAVLTLGAAMMLVPFYIMVCMSLKSAGEVASTSFMAPPTQLHWENYWTVLTNPNVSFPLFAKNTVFVAVTVTVGVVLTSALVAYPFARMSFRGKDKLFMLLLSTMMLPGIVTMIPGYVMFSYFKWIDTFLPLVVPAYFGGGAYNIFLFRQFFMGLPKELDEAAILDGATNARIFWQIVLPLSKPALATVGVFTFVGAWTDFMGPLLYLNDPDKLTLEVGLRSYSSLANTQYHLVMAAAVMVSLPLILIFLFNQRFFVRGIVMTGIK